MGNLLVAAEEGLYVLDLEKTVVPSHWLNSPEFMLENSLSKWTSWDKDSGMITIIIPKQKNGKKMNKLKKENH